MAEVQPLITHEQFVEKSNAWIYEFWPQTIGDDYDEADGWEALRFGMAVFDALGQSKVVHPEIMENALVDQVDDIAIYYALKKAAEFRRQIVVLE